MKLNQRGVALITAMLLVAIIATLATSLALGQQVWLRQTQNLTDLAQAESIRQGALQYAAALLERDAKNAQTGKTDTLKEAWAQPIPPLPVERGVVLISIADAQARFNLNNLVQQGQLSKLDVPIYARLLTQLGLSTDLVNPLIDWLDADSITLPGGAEDLDYLNHDPPYRAANQPLQSFDELRLVKGYTDDVLKKLAPFVTVLPEPRPINVNTADATVLAALTGADPSQIEQLVQARENNPFNTKADFQALFPQTTLNPKSYDVASGYFIVSIETRIGRIARRTEGLIERPVINNARAVVRWYRQPPIPITIDEDKG